LSAKNDYQLTSGQLFILLAATTSSAFPGLWYSQLFQNNPQRTKFGEPELKEVQTNKKGKKKPVLVHKERITAAVKAQSQADNNKGACNTVNPISNYHDISPREVFWLVRRGYPELILLNPFWVLPSMY
jgi:hypothetical protein